MRQFPFVPKSTRDLEVGDFWAVVLPCGDIGILQVRDVRRSGTGSLSVFVAGVVDWQAPAAPAAGDLPGRRVLAQGLVSIDVFTKGGAELLGNTSDTAPVAGLTSAFRDFHVGSITHTWGWKVLPLRVEKTLRAKQ